MDIQKSFRAAKGLPASALDSIKEMEDMFVAFASDLDNLPECREKSLAMTNLQQAKFWTIECIAKVVKE